MITTILFDMGGTLEDIWYDDSTVAEVTHRLLTFLKKHQICGDYEESVFWEKLSRGIRRYKDWSEANELELKPEQIWPDFYLSELNPDRTAAEKYAEEMAGMWEVTYYHRELRIPLLGVRRAGSLRHPGLFRGHYPLEHHRIP